jgi:hypothetical protein
VLEDEIEKKNWLKKKHKKLTRVNMTNLWIGSWDENNSIQSKLNHEAYFFNQFNVFYDKIEREKNQLKKKLESIQLTFQTFSIGNETEIIS